MPYYLLLLLVFFSCGRENTSSQESQSTYILVLTDTLTAKPVWLDSLRTSFSASAKIAVSGYPEENTDELLARLPWLLQPGVDMLIVDRGYVDVSLIQDSVKAWSPITFVLSK